MTKAFVWIDEPHLAILFNANIGYTFEQARRSIPIFKNPPRPQGCASVC